MELLTLISWHKNYIIQEIYNNKFKTQNQLHLITKFAYITDIHELFWEKWLHVITFLQANFGQRSSNFVRLEFSTEIFIISEEDWAANNKKGHKFFTLMGFFTFWIWFDCQISYNFIEILFKILSFWIWLTQNLKCKFFGNIRAYVLTNYKTT